MKQGQLVTLRSTSLPAGLDINREQRGGYRALAVMDGHGGIALANTLRPGMPARPLVQPMAATAAAR